MSLAEPILAARSFMYASGFIGSRIPSEGAFDWAPDFSAALDMPAIAANPTQPASNTAQNQCIRATAGREVDLPRHNWSSTCVRFISSPPEFWDPKRHFSRLGTLHPMDSHCQKPSVVNFLFATGKRLLSPDSVPLLYHAPGAKSSTISRVRNSFRENTAGDGTPRESRVRKATAGASSRQRSPFYQPSRPPNLPHDSTDSSEL